MWIVVWVGERSAREVRGAVEGERAGEMWRRRGSGVVRGGLWILGAC